MNASKLVNMQRSFPVAPRRQGAQPAHATGVFATTARVLLVCSLPAAVLWYPLAELPGFGSVTLLDAILLVLWPLTVAHGAAIQKQDLFARRAFRLVLVALLPGVFAAAGAFVFATLRGVWLLDINTNYVAEFALHVKRFGLAAIIPYAIAVFRSVRLRTWIVCSLLATTLIPLVLAFHSHYRDLLPIAQQLDTFVIGSRNTGAVSNPNDYAYISIIALYTTLALVGRMRVSLATKYAVWLLALGGALNGIVSSSSRSGLVAFGVSVIFIVSRRSTSPGRKIAVIVLVVLAGMYALQSSEIFQRRLSAAYEHGLQEQNFAARVEAQQVAVAAWLRYPFGVGFLNFVPATEPYSVGRPFLAVEGADSIYIDTLLGAGAWGLLALLVVFHRCWRYVSIANDTQAVVYLRAGCIAVFVFGLATIAPASPFVAPFFFFLIGSGALLAAHPRIDEV